MLIYFLKVGTGSSGAVIANRLSEDPEVSVLLVEAGCFEYGNEDISSPIKAAAVENTKDDWSFYTVSQKYSHQMKQDQAFYNSKIIKLEMRGHLLNKVCLL